VEAVAHELDGEAELGPVAVDRVAVAVDVRAREREAVALQQLEEGVLEEAERDVGAERGSQLAGARAVGVARDAGFDLGRGRAVADPGLVAGAGEILRAQGGREVEERPGRGGDRNAVVL